MIFFSLIGYPEVLFYATIHDDNSHSGNSQHYFEHVLVEKGSAVTLTCNATLEGKEGKKGKMIWFVNSMKSNVSSFTNVEIRHLTLPPPVASRNYTCKVRTTTKCSYRELELKVAGESRVLKVIKCYHYYYYCYYYYYYYCCCCYYCYYK